MSEWRVAWRHQIDGPVNDVKVDSNGMLVCTGQSLIALRPDGTTALRSDHIFDTYSAECTASLTKGENQRFQKIDLRREACAYIYPSL